jgi:high-affinity iron transporter
MLLNTVIIVLREVLEAALLVSILLAMSRLLKLSSVWFWGSALVGLLGVLLYALNMQTVSEWYDYSGQEIVNGSLQIFIYLFALILMFFSTRRGESPHHFLLLQLLMTLIIALAITREGAEIFIYLQGAMSSPGQLVSAVTGGLIGASIGASVGVLLYYALSLNHSSKALLWGQLTLGVVVSGLLSQVVPLYEQVDLLPAMTPLWDTSAILPENSVFGQLLYAVLGYEATPSPLQFFSYVSGILLFVVVLMIPYKSRVGL